MRLIDKDALVARMATVYTDTDLRAHYNEIMRAIMDTPMVDAVQVVRCKDCRYRDETDTERGLCLCTVHDTRVRPEWYCWAGYPWEDGGAQG